MTRPLDRDAILAALSPAAVLAWFSVPCRVCSDELRLGLCFTCGQRTRHDAVSVNRETGCWYCHVHGCKGDRLDMVAGLAKLDIKRDFPRVLELAADIGRVAPISTAVVGTRDKQRPTRPTRDWQAAWTSLAPHHPAGARYLAGRVLDPAALAHVVRYTRRGEPTLPARDLTTGAIVGLQHRRIDGQEPRLHTWKGSRIKKSALSGRVAALDRDGVDVAIVVEGLADTLAASLVWPGAEVFGAPGEGQLVSVVTAAAARVAEVGGQLLLVPDDDEAGVRPTADAVGAAGDAGLVLVDDDAPLGAGQLRLVDLGDHHDLADAWRAGWRWRWPERRLP